MVNQDWCNAKSVLGYLDMKGINYEVNATGLRVEGIFLSVDDHMRYENGKWRLKFQSECRTKDVKDLLEKVNGGSVEIDALKDIKRRDGLF